VRRRSRTARPALSALLAIGCWFALTGPTVAFAQGDCVQTLVATSNDDGIGGTGLSDDDGIGGTGIDGDDGIGGTGFADDDGIGGVGVYGTITGLGSICVNGLEIRYERDVSVMIFGEPSHASRLGVGHVVWVVAQRAQPGSDVGDPPQWVARSITAFNQRVGRVEAIGAGQIRVGGETIVWLDSAPMFAQPGEAGFEVGDWVAISGLRRADGTLVASRIDSALPKQATTPIQLEWLLSDKTLSAFSVEGYLGTSALDAIDVDAAIDELGTGARVWIESVVEPDGIRPTAVVERDYPGDVPIEPGLVDPDLGSTSDHEPMASRPDRDATRDRPTRSWRDFWSLSSTPRSVSPGSDPVDSPIDSGSVIDAPIDTRIDAIIDAPIDSPIESPDRLDSLGGR